MTVSVIVSTYNGAQKISDVLTALRHQTYQDFELIVAIDGSTDDTLNVLDQFRNLFIDFKVVTQANKGRSAIRNFGALVAKGDLLIFYDDDMIPDENSVQQHYQFYLQNNYSLLSGNPVEHVEEKKTDVQNYKATLTRYWMNKYPAGVSKLDRTNLFFTAANCSIPRSIFNDFRGFNENLSDGEDYDLAKRAMLRDIPVMLDRGNVAVHNEYITARSYVKRLREYEYAHAKLLVKKPNGFFKKWIYQLSAHSFWITCIDNEKMKWIPQVIRYKWYNIVFHALSVEYPEVKI